MPGREVACFFLNIYFFTALIQWCQRLAIEWPAPCQVFCSELCFHLVGILKGLDLSHQPASDRIAWWPSQTRALPRKKGANRKKGCRKAGMEEEHLSVSAWPSKRPVQGNPSHWRHYLQTSLTVLTRTSSSSAAHKDMLKTWPIWVKH